MKYLPLALFLSLLACTNMTYLVQADTNQDSLKQILQNDLSDSSRVEIFIQLSNSYFYTKLDSSLIFAQMALEAAEISKNSTAKVKTFRLIGLIYNEKGDHITARDYHLKALEIVYETTDSVGIASTLGNIGNTYLDMGDSENAYRYYMDALEIFNNIAHTRGIALCEATLGNLLLNEGNYTSAREHYENAQEKFLQTGDDYTAAITIMNIGITLRRDGKLEEAKRNFITAKKIFKRLNKLKNEAQCIANLARVEFERKEYKYSIDLDFKALEILKTIDSKHEIALTLNDIAVSCDSLNNNTLALKYYLQAYDVYYSVNPWSDLNLDLNKNIARCYSKTGDYDKAYDYITFAFRIQDTISVRKQKEIIADMLTKYELDKKNIEIEVKDLRLAEQEANIKRSKLITYSAGMVSFLLLILVFLIFNRFRLKRKTSHQLELQANGLKQALGQLQDSERGLKELNATKDTFFSILAHDLRGPFNAFINLSELLAEDQNSFTPDETNELLSKMHSSALNLYKLLENLLDWARMQNNTMGFVPEVLKLRSILEKDDQILKDEASEKGIELRIENFNKGKIYGDLYMVQTVFRNLIFNAIKFTHEGGKIMVRSKENESFFEFEISDNGTGIPLKVKDKLFKIEYRQSSKGTKNELGTGLGLIICKEFVEKNKGSIRVESVEGKGSSFFFALPKAETQ